MKLDHPSILGGKIGLLRKGMQEHGVFGRMVEASIAGVTEAAARDAADYVDAGVRNSARIAGSLAAQVPSDWARLTRWPSRRPGRWNRTMVDGGGARLSAKHMKHPYPIVLALILSAPPAPAASLAPAPAASLPTAQAVVGTWRRHDVAFARVRARQETVLSLPFAARVTELDVEPGVEVSAGDELARVDAPILRQHFSVWDQKRQGLALARKRLRLLRENEKQRIVTRQELVMGEQEVSQAEGEAHLAWQMLASDLDFLHANADEKALAEQTERHGALATARSLGGLHAPFSGMVVERRAVLGEQLAAGQPLLELETVDRVYLEVGVGDAELPRWRGGESRWHAGLKPVVLKPVATAPRYDTTTGLWLLRFEAANPALARRDGAWVEVEHLGAAEPVVWVPEAAVVARNGKTWCVEQQGDRSKAVEVRVGAASADGRIPVLAGLEAETRVVTKGAYELLYRDLKNLVRFED